MLQQILDKNLAPNIAQKNRERLRSVYLVKLNFYYFRGGDIFP